MQYEIQTKIGNIWENTITDDEGNPVTFTTAQEAVDELAQHQADIAEAVANGDMLPSYDAQRIVSIDSAQGIVKVECETVDPV